MTAARDSRHSPYGHDPQGRGAEPEWRGDARSAAIAHPVLHLIDELSSIETPATLWLRQAGPIARQLNEESLHD